MASNPRFWNMLARTYSRQKIGDEAAYQAKLEKTRAYFTPQSDVLEFGCGTGGTAILHAPFVKHVRAIDFSRKMIAIARDNLANSDVRNVEFEVASISDLDVTASAYDVVMGMSILHLLDDRVAVLAKVYQLLKPGGVFVSSTVCVSGSAIMRAGFAVGKAVGLLPTLNFITKSQLESDVREAGLDIIESWQPKDGASVFIVARKLA